MTTRPRTLIAAIAAALALAACNGTGAVDGDTTAASSGADATTIDAGLTSDASNAEAGTSVAITAASTDNGTTHEAASDYDYDPSDAVRVVLSDSGSSADSPTVDVAGSVVTITQAGTFTVTGSLSDGQMVVDADDQVVRLVLDFVDITNSAGAAVAVLDAEKVIIELAAGTTSTLTDGSSYTFPDAGTDEPNATLFSVADLTITGDGALGVNANYNDGIASKDGLIIDAGTITVDAVDDAVRGKDYVVVGDATLIATAGGDAVKADNADDATLGYVTIDGATLGLIAGGDAISAETDVLIATGTVDIGTTGSGAATSAKGIKGLASVVIDGGTITIDSADDAVHSNDTIAVTGGELMLTTGDDAVHADAMLTIADATITITDSYEGLESAVIQVDSGTIEIHSGDDGVNVAGGQDASGFAGRSGRGGGGDQFAVNRDYQLIINGGTIVIYAHGDGLDSNGIATMTGGIAIVRGPTANNNGAIDAGSFDISGGVLIAVGSAGMAAGVDATSTQASLEATTRTTLQAGTIIHIETADDDPVLTFEPAKEFASIVFSSPELDAGAAYDVYFGGTASGDDVGGMYDAASSSDGDLVGTITAG